MKYELTQRFYFEAAHTLHRQIDAESSRRIHGHTYLAEATVTGEPHPTTGMLVDLAELRGAIERVREMLDHRFLDEVPGIGHPTLENLCTFVWKELLDPRWSMHSVIVRREASGDQCRLSA